jgi:hypothetical protein
MISLRRFVAEPLVQFLIIGTLVFGAYSLLDRSPRGTDSESIDVGPGRITQLVEIFARTWQRPPTPEELNGLIEAFVKEEIFYREGRKMGLDRDDTVFRRRLQQKMEFLLEPSAAELTPSEGELATYLAANAEAFRVPARIAFRQVFFDPAKSGDAAEGDMEALLARLNENGAAVDPGSIGDPTLLPQAMPLTPIDQVEYSFGREFAAKLPTIEPGRWEGPIRSTFGLHLVLVEERTEARDPPLAEARDVVLREWQSQKRRTAAAERYKKLRENYKVTVTLPQEGKSE